MLHNFRPLLISAVIAMVPLVAFGCDDDSSTQPTATPAPTQRSLPPPVSVSPEPQEIGLADPDFEALPGATADFGRLHGFVYRIEVPDNWNRRLVLYMHGFEGLAPEAHVYDPGIRPYLIRNGYAWGAASYSSTALIPGRAADETAALWDYFAGKHGRPDRTYVTGHSMGGAATHIAAERYADRFDGALGICGYAGQTAQAQLVNDWFFAAAYAAGIRQADITPETDYNTLIYDRIVPALDADPAKRETFESVLVAITGGPRVFDRLGLHAEELTNWERSKILIATRIGMNANREYVFASPASVSADDFNRDVIRLADDEERFANFIAQHEITGDLQIPMITLHTTGDWQVPIDQQQILRRTVESAGKGDMLVQRIIRDPFHCSTTATEWEDALEDLVQWVENGVTPEGEDVLLDDLTDAGTDFTLAPRFGSPEADAVPGADKRLSLTGTVTVDGAPSDDAFFWLEVHQDGLRAACSFPGDVTRQGAYQRTIASADEVVGCGQPGDEIWAVAFVDDAIRYAGPFTWPEGNSLDADLAFDTSNAPDITATQVYGTVLDGNGRHVAPGALIEAYVDDTLCGTTSLATVEMDFAGSDRYLLLVAGPEDIPGCTDGAPIEIRVDGVPVAQTATNDGQDQNVDLIVE